jgi:hypothetical protein
MCQNSEESIDCVKQESLTGIEVSLWRILSETFSDLPSVYNFQSTVPIEWFS